MNVRILPPLPDAAGDVGGGEGLALSDTEVSTLRRSASLPSRIKKSAAPSRFAASPRLSSAEEQTTTIGAPSACLRNSRNGARRSAAEVAQPPADGRFSKTKPT